MSFDVVLLVYAAVSSLLMLYYF